MQLEILPPSEHQVERPEEGAVAAVPDRRGHLTEVVLREGAGYFERITYSCFSVVRFSQQ
ncbi:hypothetical protein V8017_20580 [Stenotrophomonas rhizophila]